MERMMERVCGIDVHKATLSGCVRVGGAQGSIEQEIGSFGTTGDELLDLRQWLSSRDVTHVAIEATGV
jgi:transposase